MVAELLAVQIAGVDPVAKAGIPLVGAIGGVIADRAACLLGFVIAAKHRPSRHANGTVYCDAVLHQYVQHACGKHPPHGAAFQNQACLHTDLLLVLQKPDGCPAPKQALCQGCLPPSIHKNMESTRENRRKARLCEKNGRCLLSDKKKRRSATRCLQKTRLFLSAGAILGSFCVGRLKMCAESIQNSAQKDIAKPGANPLYLSKYRSHPKNTGLEE